MVALAGEGRLGLKPDSNQSLGKLVSSSLQYLYQQWVIGMRANNNKKAVLSVLTKTFFSSTRKKEPGRLTQIHVVRNASRGVLRLSPGLIKLREESTHAGHRCMSSGDQQSFVRGGSA